MLSFLGVEAVASTIAVDINDEQFRFSAWRSSTVLLCIPFWTRNHWILLTLEAGVLSVFDSAPSTATCSDVRLFATKLLKHVSINRLRFSDCPKQPRGSNQCGVHVLANATLAVHERRPPFLPVIDYDALRYLIDLAIADGFHQANFKTEFISQVLHGSSSLSERKFISVERVRSISECLINGDRIAIEWKKGSERGSETAVVVEGYNTSHSKIWLESGSRIVHLPTQGVDYSVVDILPLSPDVCPEAEWWNTARTWKVNDEVQICWLNGEAPATWIGVVSRPATLRTPARLICDRQLSNGVSVPLIDDEDGMPMPIQVEFPDREVHYFSICKLPSRIAPTVSPVRIPNPRRNNDAPSINQPPVAAQPSNNSQPTIHETNDHSPPPRDPILHELPQCVVETMAQFPVRSAKLLRGTDVLHLPINLSQTPQLCLLGLAKATRKHHIAIIRLLSTMDVDLHNAPLDIALLEFFTRLKTRRRWLLNTMKTKIYSAQGALRLLPLYCGQGVLPITLSQSTLWSQATTGIQKLAKEDLPRKAKPVTVEQMTQLSQLPEEYACFFLLAWIFAARVGDLLQVAPKDVYLSGEAKIQIRFCRGKTASTRPHTVTSHMPTDPNLRAKLFHFLSSRNPQAKAVFSLKASAIRIALKSIARYLSLHSIRRGALQFMAATGVHMPDIMRLSGHKTEASLLAYLDDGLICAETAADVARTRPLAATLSGAGDVSCAEEWKHKSYEFIASAFPPVRDIGKLPLHVKDVPHISLEKLRSIPVAEPLKQRLATALAWLDDSTKYLRRHCVLLPRHGFSETQAELMFGSKFTEFNGLVTGTVYGFGVVELKTSPERVYERIRPVFNPRVNKDLDKSVLQPSTLPPKHLVRQHGMIKEDEHVIQFDFGSYYDQFPLAPDVRALFCFLYKEQTVALNSLPMGLRTACEVAQAATEVMCSGTEASVHCDIYIDNVRFVGPKQALIRSVKSFLHWIKEVGATIDFTPPIHTDLDEAIAGRFEKRGEFLGELYDYEAGTRSLSKKSMRKLDMVKEPTTIRQLAAVIGLALWTADTLDVKCFTFFELFRRWRRAASEATGKGTEWGLEPLSLSKLEGEQLSQLLTILRKNTPTSMSAVLPTSAPIIRIVTDASGWGWGALAWFDDQATPIQRQGQWSGADSLKFQKSVMAEPEAVYKACIELVPNKWTGQVHIYTDHLPIVLAAGKRLIKGFSLNQLMMRLHSAWPDTHFQFSHIAGVSNEADALSRGAHMR